MTDKQRITEILKAYTKKHNISASTVILEEYAEELVANGVIVPPVSVGQTVYSFCDVFGGFLPYVIQDFKVGFMGKDRPNYWYWEATSHALETDELLDEIDFDIEEIGKTVFLTKEEAERELEKRCKE